MVDKDAHKDIYAVVGELVMISNAIDHLLNNVLISVLHLTKSPMLEPVVATIDPRQKIEILKERAKHIDAKDWQKGITKFLDKTESVFRQRNIVCHTPAILNDGKWAFKPISAAKILKKIDLENKTLAEFPLNDIRTAIAIGEEALGAGLTLLENYDRANIALAQRQSSTNAPKPSDK